MSYIGSKPGNLKSNTGVLSVNDAKIAEEKGQLGGALEFITSASVTSGATIELTNIKQDIYDVHLLVGRDIGITTTGFSFLLQFSTDGGSTYKTANTDYAQASEYHDEDGSTVAVKNNAMTGINPFGGNYINEGGGFVMHLYGLGNSTTYVQTHTIAVSQDVSSDVNTFWGGNSVDGFTSTVDAIRLAFNGTNTFTSGTLALWGYRKP